MHTTRSNLGLDVVRAAAILAVLFSHTYTWWLGPGRGAEIIAAYIGGAGVEVFFSLSGFLIGGILLRAARTGLDLPALRRFWLRRWMRTLPAYWTLIVLLSLHFGTWDWRTPLFLQSFAPFAQWTPLTPHTWSLVLEEWFYLFVPPLFAAALALRRSALTIPVVCAALIFASTLARAAVGLEPGRFWGPDPANNPLLRLDCAAWGVLAACWTHRAGFPRRGPAWVLLLSGLTGLAALAALFTASFTPERLAPFGFAQWSGAYAALRPSLIELAAAAAVLGAGALLPTGHGPLAWLAGATARLSYALYLVHVPVLYLLRGAGWDDDAGWPVRALFAAAVLAAAVLMRVLVELPVLAWRDRTVPDGGTPPAPSWLHCVRHHPGWRRLDPLARLFSRTALRFTLPLAAAAAALAVFAIRARVGLVTLEFGDETEKYVAAAMIRAGGTLYQDIFANHGPLAYALAWLCTLVGGTQDFTRARLIVVALALAAAAAIATSPVLTRLPARAWATALFLAPLSALWIMHPFQMLIYHALGGYLLTIAIAQLTLPALLGARVRAWNGFSAGAAIALAVTAAYPFAVAGSLFLAVAAVGLWRHQRPALGRIALWTFLGGCTAAAPVAAWVTVKASWTGLYVYHVYLNQAVYARVTGFSPLNAFHALAFPLDQAGRVHTFALLAGLLALGALVRPNTTRLASVALLAAGMLMLNPKGETAFPDTAQLIGCLALLALIGGHALAQARALSLGAGLLTAVAYAGTAELVARTALVSPHGIPRAAAKPVYLRPDPANLLAQFIHRYAPKGTRILALPFMPATYIEADRLPASGAYYDLPFQTEYNAAPILGWSIDLCADIRRTRPPVIVVQDAPLGTWGSVTQYEPCLGTVLRQEYEPSPILDWLHVRRDREGP